MKTIKRTLLLLTILAVGANLANAQSFGDLLGGLGGLLGGGTSQGQTGNGGSSTLGNLLEGVFSSSNLTVEDLGGEWKSLSLIHI